MDRYFRVKKEPRVCFAGQITGVEGYVESTASGFLAAVELARRLEGKPPVDFPQETAVGALARYVSNESVTDFQPMNVNFGIIPPLGYRVMGKRNKNAELSKRALELLDVLDNFERALDQEGQGDSFKEGMEMIFKQLGDVLKKSGLAEIPALGEEFDPNFHNAVMSEETDDYESGKVSGVMQKGYTLNGKVIRPSMVKVAG